MSNSKIIDMKRTKLISAIILLAVLIGCGGNKQSTDELIIVDVSRNHPEKELILQDFMDVEYVALETTDEFITQGVVEDVGKHIILVRNYRDGDIFVFDRTGRAIRKINRLGQGAEEYSQNISITLNEDNNEMFVKDHNGRKILVYDLNGIFKRSFKFIDDSIYDYIFNYDRDNLICYKNYFSVEDKQSCHILISKQDGSVTREIHIPFKEFKTPFFKKDDLTIMPAFYLTFPYPDKWLLVSTSSDTVYTYLPDGNIRPFIVRTPSIQSMEPEVFLYPSVITDRYYFMYTQKKEVDLKTMKGFPITELVYDKQENALFKSTVYNGDFSNKKKVPLNLEAVNQEIAIYQPLNAFDLIEANEKGQLKGRLKEIAAELDEESNPVIMLVKYKK